MHLIDFCWDLIHIVVRDVVMHLKVSLLFLNLHFKNSTHDDMVIMFYEDAWFSFYMH